MVLLHIFYLLTGFYFNQNQETEELMLIICCHNADYHITVCDEDNNWSSPYTAYANLEQLPTHCKTVSVNTGMLIYNNTYSH